MFKNISDFNNVNDYLPILNAVLITDMVVILLLIFGFIKSKVLVEWYKKYNLSAVIEEQSEIKIKFDEIWKQLREKSMRSIESKRQSGEIELKLWQNGVCQMASVWPVCGHLPAPPNKTTGLVLACLWRLWLPHFSKRCRQCPNVPTGSLLQIAVKTWPQ